MLDVAHLRTLLAEYDEGILTEQAVRSQIFRRAIEQLLAVLDGGDEVLCFTSWCGLAPSPGRKVRVEIAFDPDCIKIHPLP